MYCHRLSKSSLLGCSQGSNQIRCGRRTVLNDGDPVDEAQQQHQDLTPDDEAHEVNSVFGWAIQDLRRKLSGQRFELKHGDDDVDVDDVTKIVDLLDSMPMFHDAASMKHKLINHGWLL